MSSNSSLSSRGTQPEKVVEVWVGLREKEPVGGLARVGTVCIITPDYGILECYGLLPMDCVTRQLPPPRLYSGRNEYNGVCAYDSSKHRCV